MKCKYCGSENVETQVVSVAKKRGCLSAIMWLLLGLCTCGLIWIIPLLTKKGSKTQTYVVCQNCGKRYKI